MNRKTYRICLIILIIAAMISGIYYYRSVQKEELNPQDGIFVRENGMGRADV